MQNRYNRRNRRKYSLKVHIVLVTKYRKALLQNGIDCFVKRAISYLAEQNNWAIIATETDHVLLEYDATERICDIISVINREQRIGSGYGIEMYYPSNIGRNTSSGQTDTLPVASEKYHQQPSKNI